MESQLGIPLYRELGNPLTEELLARFYADKRRWALTLQVHFLGRRFRLVKAIMAHKGHGALDRSIFGDRLFADQLHSDGDMDDNEHRVYADLVENMLQHVEDPEVARRIALLLRPGRRGSS
jgi:deoxyadenosine/deoxycytidine kinase